jgi:hypothetical protein
MEHGRVVTACSHPPPLRQQYSNHTRQGAPQSNVGPQMEEAVSTDHKLEFEPSGGEGRNSIPGDRRTRCKAIIRTHAHLYSGHHRSQSG